MWKQWREKTVEKLGDIEKKKKAFFDLKIIIVKFLVSILLVLGGAEKSI